MQLECRVTSLFLMSFCRLIFTLKGLVVVETILMVLEMVTDIAIKAYTT